MRNGFILLKKSALLSEQKFVNIMSFFYIGLLYIYYKLF